LRDNTLFYTKTGGEKRENIKYYLICSLNIFKKKLMQKKEQVNLNIPYDIYESPQEIVILMPLG